MSNYTFSGSVGVVEYIGTGFNHVQATVKFGPLYWWPFLFYAN